MDMIYLSNLVISYNIWHLIYIVDFMNFSIKLPKLRRHSQVKLALQFASIMRTTPWLCPQHYVQCLVSTWGWDKAKQWKANPSAENTIATCCDMLRHVARGCDILRHLDNDKYVPSGSENRIHLLAIKHRTRNNEESSSKQASYNSAWEA